MNKGVCHEQNTEKQSMLRLIRVSPEVALDLEFGRTLKFTLSGKPCHVQTRLMSNRQ